VKQLLGTNAKAPSHGVIDAYLLPEINHDSRTPNRNGYKRNSMYPSSVHKTASDIDKQEINVSLKNSMVKRTLRYRAYGERPQQESVIPSEVYNNN
jgi:hypothetical protein